MKNTNRALLFIGAALTSIITFVSSANAGKDEDDNISSNVPFTLSEKTWVNQRAFIDSGARCATKHPDEIKAQIEKLVSDEDPKRPLTDQAIVNILKESGVQIARRTVAKYRDQLGVLSARMRKRV